RILRQVLDRPVEIADYLARRRFELVPYRAVDAAKRLVGRLHQQARIGAHHLRIGPHPRLRPADAVLVALHQDPRHHDDEAREAGQRKDQRRMHGGATSSLLSPVQWWPLFIGEMTSMAVADCK